MYSFVAVIDFSLMLCIFANLTNRSVKKSKPIFQGRILGSSHHAVLFVLVFFYRLFSKRHLGGQLLDESAQESKYLKKMVFSPYCALSRVHVRFFFLYALCTTSQNLIFRGYLHKCSELNLMTIAII